MHIYVLVKSKLQHPPPPPPRAYPGHLTPLLSWGGGNLIIRVFQGLGNFIPIQRVGNLNRTLDFMWNLWELSIACGELSWRTQCWRIFVEEIVPLWPIGCKERVKRALCHIWKYLDFNIFDIGFRLWIYECIKLCLHWNTIRIVWPTVCPWFNTSIKSSTEVNYFDLPRNGDEYRMYGM